MKKLLVSLLFFIGYNIQAQNVGIGTTTPTGPLTFNSVLGNKIDLWGGWKYCPLWTWHTEWVTSDLRRPSKFGNTIWIRAINVIHRKNADN